MYTEKGLPTLSGSCQELHSYEAHTRTREAIVQDKNIKRTVVRSPVVADDVRMKRGVRGRGVGSRRYNNSSGII